MSAFIVSLTNQREKYLARSEQGRKQVANCRRRILPVALAVPMVVVRFDHSSIDGAYQGVLEKHVEADATRLLQSESLATPHTVELSITLSDDPFIQSLNAQYLGKNYPTDVLSFPLASDEYSTEEDDSEKIEMLGDIVISIDTAKRQADERNLDLRDELRILLVHGILHLLGYDHELSADDHREMADAEKTLMEGMSWTGTGLLDMSS